MGRQRHATFVAVGARTRRTAVEVRGRRATEGTTDVDDTGGRARLTVLLLMVMMMVMVVGGVAVVPYVVVVGVRGRVYHRLVGRWRGGDGAGSSTTALVVAA
ncbi:hypothetical protein EGW08_009008, partial [Elysia chlorotica]